MKILRNEAELKAELEPLRREGKTIGFVPTMGALHEGHGALLRRAAREHPVAVLSIFVNPTQFGPQEDFSRYPRTFEADRELAEREGVTHIFAPTAEVIYPPGWSTFLEVEGVTAPLCGSHRPGHFRGVATVVNRLFSLVNPTVAYFGQKDLQQCLVIQRMVRDLSLAVKVEICPTVREADGLALSSRNRYLSPEERAKAAVIFRALKAARQLFQQGERSVEKLENKARQALAAVPEFTVQYCELRSLPDLAPISVVEGEAALAIAGFLGKTRLIDNIILA